MSRFYRYCFIAALISSVIMPSFILAQLGGPKELRKVTAKPDEIISISKSLPFDEAMEMFNGMSKKHLKKVIIAPSTLKEPIGVNIDKMHWLDAFELVLKQNNLVYEEYADHILVKPTEKTGPSQELLTKRELFQTREVVISAVFFEANTNMLREFGVSWNLIGTNAGDNVNFSAAATKSGLLEINTFENLDFGSITAIFKTMENNQLGEVIASPQITVCSGKQGKIQIGTDFSVTTQDFSGNTITQMFSTGAILDVQPQIITIDTTTFVHIIINAERSSGSTSESGLEIKKTEASTSVLLLDGEETMIGGLYSNEENLIREGIPLLKDLPWWFFGLRYLFGYNSKTVNQKELIILLRADLLPSLAERITKRSIQLDESELLNLRLNELNERLQKIKIIKSNK